MYTLYQSLVQQCEYTIQPKVSSWCHAINTEGTVLYAIDFSLIGPLAVTGKSPMNWACPSFHLEVFLELRH